MSKYVIKNCPCIVIDECNSFRDDEVFCKDCTDCVMKQIYEICKDNALVGGIDETAEKVVDLLDIQEVE